MFDTPTRVEVDAMRDRAMTDVQTSVEADVPHFTDRACAFVLRYLEANGPTSGEVLSVQAKQAGIVPHDDRAFGPVYMRLARRRLIEKTGTVRRERGHGTAGGNIWRRTLPARSEF